MLGKMLFGSMRRSTAFLSAFFKLYSFKSGKISKSFLKRAKFSPIILSLSGMVVSCLQGQDNSISELQELTMQQLVKILHEVPSQQFVVVVYNKFEKNKNPVSFASELRVIIDECKRANVNKIYTINSRDAKYLEEIVRRLKNYPKDSLSEQKEGQKKQKRRFECYFKSKSYSEAFELLNSKDYRMSEQINETRNFQVKTNNLNINQQLTNHMNGRFATNKSIVVKQCPNEGECVDSFRKQVRKLMDEGLLMRKSKQYQFQVVVDHPTGLLSKSTEYIKTFHASAQKLAQKHLPWKEDMLVFRKDIIGSEVGVWSEWVEKDGANIDKEERMMMFLKPRINIISKCNAFNDLMWYMRTSTANDAVSLSLNNTQKWEKTNSLASLQVLKLLYKNHPKLNYLIINSQTAGEIIHHVHADYKYAIFKPTRLPVWNKRFLKLDQLEVVEGEQREKLYNSQFKQAIDKFVAEPVDKDLVVVEKQLEISLDKLVRLKQKQVGDGSEKQKCYVIRVCDERCGRYLKEETVQQLQKRLDEKMNVYWIDNSVQNVGVNGGDYLLTQGKLIEIGNFLVKQPQS